MDKSCKFDNDEHPLNILYILVTLLVFHLDISGKFNNDNNIIIYKIDVKKDIIKIFGKDFVENNIKKITIEIEGKEYKLNFYNIIFNLK